MQKLRQVAVANKTKQTMLGSRIRVAETSIARGVGLLATKHLDPGDGLWIIPSSGIHTFGMRFLIDVVALDRNLRVLGLWERLGGFRLAALNWKTRSVLELPAGAIRESGTELNDQLVVTS
jgi:uncharacterized membrane protein (UPF0127 family)